MRPLDTARIAATADAIRAMLGDDEDAVPTQLCEMKRVVDKAAVKKALEAGETIPGAELVKGADSVSVRVK